MTTPSPVQPDPREKIAHLVSDAHKLEPEGPPTGRRYPLSLTKEEWELLRRESARADEAERELAEAHKGTLWLRDVNDSYQQVLSRSTRNVEGWIAAQAEADRLRGALRATADALDGEIEQHEAFFLQSGMTKGWGFDVHEAGIAAAKRDLDAARAALMGGANT